MKAPFCVRGPEVREVMRYRWLHGPTGEAGEREFSEPMTRVEALAKVNEWNRLAAWNRLLPVENLGLYHYWLD